MEIKIRFNTEKEKLDGSLPAWRVIENGIERLANKVFIKTDSWTTMDQLMSGQIKWHVSCRGKACWNNDTNECVITND